MNRKQIYLLALTGALDTMLFGATFTLVPFVIKRLGGAAVDFGLFFASMAFLALLSAAFWGKFSDRVGRKPVLLTLFAGNILSMVILAMSTSVKMVQIGGGVLGLFGVATMVITAAVGDLSEAKNRTKAVGIVGGASSLGTYVVGPGLVSLGADYGFQATFFALAAICGIAFLVTLVLVEVPLVQKKGSSKKSKEKSPRLRDVFSSSQVRGATFSNFLYQLGNNMVMVSLTLFLVARIGIDEKQSGYVGVTMGASCMLMQFFITDRLTRVFSEVKLVAGAVLLWAGMNFGFTLAQSLEQVLGLCVCFGLLQGVILTVLSSLNSRGALPGAQGITMGIYQASTVLSGIIGGIFGGILFDKVSLFAPQYASMGIMIVASLFCWTYRWERGKAKGKASLRSAA